MSYKNIINFLLLWAGTALLLALISAIFPADVVLGNNLISKPMASLVNGLVLAIVIYYVPTLSKKLELKIKHEKFNLVYYFAADLVVIWVLKRFADVTGFGVSSILFVIVLAVLAAIVQFKVLKYGPKLLKTG